LACWCDARDRVPSPVEAIQKFDERGFSYVRIRFVRPEYSAEKRLEAASRADALMMRGTAPPKRC